MSAESLSGKDAQAQPNQPSSDPVIVWNRILINLQATAGVQPSTIQPTYELALLHLAIYDAVVSIDHSAKPYLFSVEGPRDASLRAAVDTAAHDTPYPSAHSTFGAATAAVLSSIFGPHFDFAVSSSALPGVGRSFTSFNAAGEEAGLSRIIAGVHTRIDHAAGGELGADVARFVLDNFLTR